MTIHLHQDLAHVPPDAMGCVMAIGNFDGVHSGHKVLIEEAGKMAHIMNAPLGVMTFEPHPREVLKPTGVPFRLTPLMVKLRKLGALGVHHLFAPTFDAKFSTLSPEGFIKLLKEDLGVRHVVTGEDFQFGRAAAGNVALLEKHLEVTAISPVTTPDRMLYSSTRARAAIQQGNFKAAAELLGWEWYMESAVIHGNQRGRLLGMPTANQKTGSYVHMPFGVYAVEVQLEKDKNWRKGVANFGIRPMFEVKEPLLETHIFNFDADIYGKTLRVKPIAFLRPEAKFDSIEALVAQMKQDCKAAQASLSSRV